MTKHKQTKHQPKRAKKIKVLKVTPIEPDKHIVELEIEGAPEPLPEVPLPLEFEPGVINSKDAPESGVWNWLKSIFG
ncbi:MAG: hypothetical protein WBA09_22290 [Candidatus Acidiferrum sp.]